VQTFDVVKTSEYKESFRTRLVKDSFDLQTEKVEERFKGEIDLSGDWKIGVIWGNSGTGKTVIAKEIFGEDYVTSFAHSDNSIIDDFQDGIETREIFSILNSVGFSSPPSWLKPYSVLSNGEKMRVDLALALLSDKKTIVFDEFTSVVDRTVAKVGSHAVSKAIRRSNKRFVAVACHSDILEWLQPDWELCTDDMQFTRRSLQRPSIELQIYKEKGKWVFFRKHHYLNHDLNHAAKQFVGYIDGKPVGFCAVLHQPHSKSGNIKRCTRLVVVPDYQGLGIGGRMLDYIGKKYLDDGYRFTIVTSNPALNHSLKKNSNWKLRSVGRKSKHQGIRQTSANRKTFSWEIHS